MNIYVVALLLGVIAGLRSMTAPAAVSWAAYLGWIKLEGTWFAFLGFRFTPYLLTFMAIGEFIGDKLPFTPSRKALFPFAGRIGSGALCGAAVGAGSGNWLFAALAGAIGAVIGTLGGYELRTKLVKAFGGRDLPIALIEDLIAVCGAYALVSQL